MSEVEEHGNSVILKSSKDPEKRIEILTLLFEKAESKVTHADMYRQRNMNYSLVIFAGLVALGIKLPQQYLAQCFVSATLLILMLIFCIWDRRWHRIKHGWQGTAKEAYCNICELSNNPEQEIVIPLYKADSERKAEYFSWQPIVFYFLVVGSALSFWLFYLVKG
jgi:hypothetical protein